MPKEVESTADFDGELASAGGKLVVVDFTATWCGPCKFIAPKLAQIADENPDIVVLKVDVDDQSELTERYEISAMPTFIFIKNKAELERFSGASEQKLRDIVAKHK